MVFESGTFHLRGDRGDINWQYGGNWKQITDRDVEFSKIKCEYLSKVALFLSLTYRRD